MVSSTRGRAFDFGAWRFELCNTGLITSKKMKPICKKLGIPMATTHAFRHGKISILQQNRVPGDLIKEWVGHSSLKTTSGYRHFDDAYRQQIVSELAKT